MVNVKRRPSSERRRHGHDRADGCRRQVMQVVVEPDRGVAFVVGGDHGVVAGNLAEKRQHRRRQHLDAGVSRRVSRVLRPDGGGVNAAHANLEFHARRCYCIAWGSSIAVTRSTVHRPCPKPLTVATAPDYSSEANVDWKGGRHA